MIEAPGDFTRIGAVVATVLGALLAAFLLRRHLASIVATVFAVVIASTLTFPGATVTLPERVREVAAPRNEALPPVLHLVLDEHIGIEGIPTDLPGGAELKRELVAFYEEFGFALFSRAYSQYYSTLESLSNLMGGRASPVSDANLAVAPTGRTTVKDNRWFALLAERGYRLRVYESSFLDYCAGQEAVELCHVYPMESAAALADAPIGTTQRAWAMLLGFADASLLLRAGRVAYDWAASSDVRSPGEPERTTYDRPMLGPLLSMHVFDRLVVDVATRPAGTAWFAHVLMPHRSYLYDAECRVLPDLRDWDRGGVGNLNGSPRHNTAASRAKSYAGYFDQARCTLRQVGRVLAALRARGLLDRATIVIQGDHGSRIGLTEPLQNRIDRLTDADLVDGYSALFAVRKPGLAPGVHDEQRSIQALLAEHVLERPLAEEPAGVWIEPVPDKEGAPLTPKALPPIGR